MAQQNLNDDEQLVLDLRVAFCHEALELMQNMEGLLLDLEKAESNDKINELKRCLHCLKGSARAVGFEKFSAIYHGMESLCDGRSKLKAEIDKILKVLDGMAEALKLFLNSHDPSGILGYAKAG